MSTSPYVVLIPLWYLLFCNLQRKGCFLLGLGVGLKLFVTTYLFYRFPRLRHKLDVTVWFLDRLPTNKKAKYRTKLLPKKYSVAEALQEVAEIEIRSLQLPCVQISRIVKKCIMVDKDRSFPYSIGSGMLYVTSRGFFSKILFKYRRLAKGRREMIALPFDDILAVLKAKAIKSNFTPVHGKALEIYVPGRSTPYLLVGISNRDETYENIMTLGKMYGPSAVLAKCMDQALYLQRGRLAKSSSIMKCSELSLTELLYPVLELDLFSVIFHIALS